MAELVRAELGKNVQVGLFDPAVGSWPRRAISVATKWLGYEVGIYTAGTRVPELFCLDSKQSPTVVVSGGYLSTLGKFRRVMFDPSIGDLRVELLSQLFLETAATYCLRSGDPDLGAVVLQHTLLTRRLIIEAPPHFRPQSDPVDGTASVFVDGIFSLLHEIGHTNRDLGSVLLDFSAISDSNLLKWVEKTLADIKWMSAPVREYVLHQTVQNRDRHFLGLKNLRREIYADLFAAQQLFMVGKEAAEDEGLEFDAIALWAAIYREFNAVNVMQRARLLARTSTDHPVAQEHILDYLSYPVAMAVRSYFLALGLLSFAKGRTVLPDSELSARWFEVMSPEAVPEIADCNAAVDAASDLWFGASMEDAYARLTQILPVTGRSAHAFSDLRSYVQSAEELGIQTTYLGILRNIVDGRITGSTEVNLHEDSKILVSFLVAMSPDFDLPRLFHIPLLDEPPAIVAFTDARDARQFARDLGHRYLVAGESIDLLQEAFDHLHEIEPFIRQHFGDSMTLVIQGTISYDKFMSEASLKLGRDGVEQEHAIARARDAMADRYALYTEVVNDPVQLPQFAEIVRLIEDA